MASPPTASSLPLVAMMDFLPECVLEQKVLEKVARVVALNIQKPEAIPPSISQAEGILAWHLLHYNKEMIDKLENCKIIVRVGIGIDSVDIKYAGEKGIYVANVPDYGIEEVADSAMSHILNMMRRTALASLEFNTGRWATERAYGATRLRGRVLGIIGFGKIGKAVAIRAKVFGMRVIFYDPNIEDGLDKAIGVERADSLKALISIADVLSLNCWLDDKNKHLINRESLSWIKPEGCYLVNVARGGLIDEAALVEALQGAGLDVTEREPYPPDGPLLQFKTVLITPHSAFYSDQGFVEMREKAAKEIRRVLKGGQPRNCVNLAFMKQPRNLKQ